jgi:hypothetical protein
MWHMSIDISPAKVTAVQLPDGWHDVQAGSFKVGTHHYGDGPSFADGLDFLRDGVAAGNGFTFTEPTGNQVSGPIASVVAVRH